MSPSGERGGPPFTRFVQQSPPTALIGGPLYDLAEMLGQVVVTGAAELLFVAAPDTAITLATLTSERPSMGITALNAAPRFFPGMTPTGGEILGVPVVVSDAAQPGSLALFDASGFIANEGAIAVDRSEGGALQMRTDPTQAAATMVPLFQNHLIALRVISAFGLRRMRDNAAALALNIPDTWQGTEFVPEE